MEAVFVSENQEGAVIKMGWFVNPPITAATWAPIFQPTGPAKSSQRDQWI